jgi:hypothetical protein
VDWGLNLYKMSATIAVNEDGGSLTIPTQTSSMGSSQQTSFGGIFRRKASDSHHRTSQIPRVLTFVHLLPVGELPSMGSCQYWLGFQGFISARAQICIWVAEGPAPGRACVEPSNPKRQPLSPQVRHIAKNIVRTASDVGYLCRSSSCIA